ncbi:CMRF35-like molecule 5 [Sardina pilchardus]|uniref:CMRF35-like molecule 5 n=1 Tax=Sardina pilchardus TaxID=27697 RepID=UPI002E0FFBD4
MEMSLIFFFSLLACAHSVESVIEVTEYEGRSAVIRCPYEKRYEGNSKYLCKWLCPRIVGKDIPIRTEAGQTKAINGRFSLHDDTTAGAFTVTITGLTEGDSGKYWCGVSTGFGYTDVFTEVELNVIKARPPTPISTLVPSSSSSSSFSTPTFNTSQSGIIKKTPISADQSTAAEPQEEPEDSAVMVILCVLVLLVMVCGLVSALYYRQRRRKQTAVSSLHNSNHAEEPNDYEMSDELGSIPVARGSVSSVYCLAGAPQRPSVISLYSTVKPVTQGSDQPIYCNSH